MLNISIIIFNPHYNLNKQTPSFEIPASKNRKKHTWCARCVCVCVGGGGGGRGGVLVSLFWKSQANMIAFDNVIHVLAGLL